MTSPDAASSPPTGGDPVPNRIHARPVPRPGRWVAAALVIVLAAMALHGIVTNPKFRWDIVWTYLRDVTVVRGVGWTLVLTFGSMVIGVVLAVILAIMRRSDNPVLRSVSWFYIWFFRGTPIYTQLVFWGLISVLYPTLSVGIPFGPSFYTFQTAAVITAFWAALLGLGLNEAAYLAEIVRAGLNSVDKGQEEAARALGMKESTILRRIVIPQAMRVIVPPTGNETISMLKTTSLVLAVPFTLDLTFATNAIGNRLFEPIPLLVVSALWYLLITSVLMVGQSNLERYYGRGTDSPSPRRGGPRTPRSRKQAAINAARTSNDDPMIEVTP